MSKPPFCPFIYTDGVKLYLEFDRMVLDFVFTDAGLHKALKHIPNIAKQPGYVAINGRSNLPTAPSLKGRIARKTPQPKIARKTIEDRKVKQLRESLKLSDLEGIVRKLQEGKLK